MDDAKMIYCSLPFSNNCDVYTHPRCQEPAGWPWGIMDILYNFVTPEVEQYKVSVMKIIEEPRAEHPYIDWTHLGKCEVMDTSGMMGWTLEEQQQDVWSGLGEVGQHQEWYHGDNRYHRYRKYNRYQWHDRRWQHRQSWSHKMSTGPNYNDSYYL